MPHELNPRLHSDDQRAALAALYEEVGFARSLLAYELPDGRLKLIDGHLRQSMRPDMEVDVEVLDVDDSEARALLLSIDPLAALADYDADKLDALRRVTDADSDVLANLWRSIASPAPPSKRRWPKRTRKAAPEPAEQYLVLIECADEAEQTALLQRFQDGRAEVPGAVELEEKRTTEAQRTQRKTHRE